MQRRRRFIYRHATALVSWQRSLLTSNCGMNEVSAAVVSWLEHKRRADRKLAGILSTLALTGGALVFLLTAAPFYLFLALISGDLLRVDPWRVLLAMGITVAVWIASIRSRKADYQVVLDPVGFWILKDLFSMGPRLMLEGLRQMRCCEQLGGLDVAVCARALGYLARKNAAVTWRDLVAQCPQLPQARLREQLGLLDGVLFLGEDAARVTLMDPFRARLRWMLGTETKEAERQESTRPGSQDTSHGPLVNEPERLSAYEILGLSPSASIAEIKAAYRKRVKQCHPDLFTAMDPAGKALAERWTRALNAAYASLTPRASARGQSAAPR